MAHRRRKFRPSVEKCGQSALDRLVIGTGVANNTTPTREYNYHVATIEFVRRSLVSAHICSHRFAIPQQFSKPDGVQNLSIFLHIIEDA